jgi:hypothetical protein
MKTNHLLLSVAFSVIVLRVSGQIYTPGGLTESNTGSPTNVGIGINNPDARLVVRGTAPSGALRVTAISKYAEFGSLISDPAFLLRLQYDNTGSMQFPQGDQTVFNVDHTGRTQIGVFPIVTGDDFLAVRGSAGIYHNTTEYFRLRYANNNHELFWVSDNNRNFRFRNSNTGKIPLTLSPSGKVGVNTSDFFGNHDLYVNGSTYIKGDSPEVHSLYIEGSTVAEEIFVKVKANWPDYVFTPAHKRMSLMELDRYINTHKRLPGMPAAEKVAADGIEMGETVRLLTEKVEEITLYLIDLKKENDSLREEIESLKGGK